MEPSAQHGATTTNAISTNQIGTPTRFNNDEFLILTKNTGNLYDDHTQLTPAIYTEHYQQATNHSYLTQDYLLSQTNCPELPIMNAMDVMDAVDGDYERQILAATDEEFTGELHIKTKFSILNCMNIHMI